MEKQLMKWFFLLLFSFLSSRAFSASCCVANTSVPSLMILPSTWQQTFSLASTRVIGDVDPKGNSTFRNDRNKDSTQIAKMDLSYRWFESYQTGISFKYQNKQRELNNSQASDSGWSD